MFLESCLRQVHEQGWHMSMAAGYIWDVGPVV